MDNKEKTRRKERLRHKNWLKANPDLHQKYSRENYARGRIYDTNRYSPWTQGELNKICDPDRPSDRELAEQLRRSVQAIQVARSRYKNFKPSF